MEIKFFEQFKKIEQLKFSEDSMEILDDNFLIIIEMKVALQLAGLRNTGKYNIGKSLKLDRR